MEERINPAIRLRTMQESDFPDCQRLREQVGWNQTMIDWRRFLSYNPQGCFVAALPERIVGTACTIPYEDRFGWVAMVIVDRDCRRLGIGTLLLNAGIEHLEKRGLTVKLDATPAGKMLYDTLGFHDEYGLARMECMNGSFVESKTFLTPIRMQDIDALIDYDAPRFGATRKQVLESYLHYYPQFAFWMRETDSIQGYIMAREGTNAFHIGPWVAENPEIACCLVQSVLQIRKPDKVFVDIVEPNPPVRTMLESLGFQEQRPFIRMFKGINNHPGMPDRTYGITGPELG